MPAPAPAGRVLPGIIEQHADEAAFLWLLRDRAADAPNYVARHLWQLDGRIEAHLDGLLIAGEIGRELALAQLDRNQEPGEMFAAAVVALAIAESTLLAQVLEVAACAPETRRGLLGALAWTPREALRLTVRRWLDADDPLLRYLAVAACSLHRVDTNTRLPALLDDPDAKVRARAYRLAAEVGRADLRERIAAAADWEEGLPRDWATWSAALLGDPLATRGLEPIVEMCGPVSGPALEVLTRRGPQDRVASWVRAINGDPARRRIVIRAVGAIGDPAALHWLLARMDESTLARLAGASFALITGVDIAEDGFEAPSPAGFVAGPTEEPSDEDTAPDPDEALPWPDPGKLRAWLDLDGERLARGERYLLGRRVDADGAEVALEQGYQNQRRAAAFELAAHRPESGVPAWRARAGR